MWKSKRPRSISSTTGSRRTRTPPKCPWLCWAQNTGGRAAQGLSNRVRKESIEVRNRSRREYRALFAAKEDVQRPLEFETRRRQAGPRRISVFTLEES